MSETDLHKSEPPQIARVLAVDPAAPEALAAADLAAVLRHQLDTPLSVDLADADAPVDLLAATTFGELLGAEKPALDLLERVRRFAKSCKGRADGPLPPEVATVLYFAAIVKARVACGVRASALGDEDVLRGVRWCLQQPWVGPPTRELLETGAASLA